MVQSISVFLFYFQLSNSSEYLRASKLEEGLVKLHDNGSVVTKWLEEFTVHLLLYYLICLIVTIFIK